MGCCSYYNRSRMPDLRRFILGLRDVADDAWVKVLSDLEANYIHTQFIFAAEYLDQCYRDIF